MRQLAGIVYQTPGIRRFVRAEYAAYSSPNSPTIILFRSDAKCAEDRERDQVRRTCHPIWDDESLANGIQR